VLDGSAVPPEVRDEALAGIAGDDVVVENRDRVRRAFSFQGLPGANQLVDHARPL